MRSRCGSGCGPGCCQLSRRGRPSRELHPWGASDELSRLQAARNRQRAVHAAEDRDPRSASLRLTLDGASPLARSVREEPKAREQANGKKHERQRRHSDGAERRAELSLGGLMHTHGSSTPPYCYDVTRPDLRTTRPGPPR